MARTNTIEAEVDAIRDKIYEETKDLTREQQAKRLRDKTERAAVKYGFVIQPSTSTRKTSNVI